MSLPETESESGLAFSDEMCRFVPDGKEDVVVSMLNEMVDECKAKIVREG